MCWFQVPSFFSYLIERHSSCYFLAKKTCGEKFSGMDTHVVHGFPEQLQLVLGHGANLHKEHSEASEKCYYDKHKNFLTNNPCPARWTTRLVVSGVTIER